MQTQGRDWLAASDVPEDRRAFARVIDARYKGQNHEVQVALPEAGAFTLDAFRAAFTAAHRQEYGYDVPDRVIEVVNCRLKAIGRVTRPATPPRVEAAAAPPPRATREVHFDTGWHATPVFDRATLGAGTRIAGPAIIDEMSSTTVVEPGQFVSMDEAGNLILEIAA